MLIKFINGNVFTDNKLVNKEFFIDANNCFTFYDEKLHSKLDFDFSIDCKGLYVFPGFIDPHVHLREPGFSYKDTIRTASLSAAKGGYTDVFAMPNLDPVPNSLKNLQIELDMIKQDSCVHVHPVCSITKNQSGKGDLSDISELSKEYKYFSDDGKGIQESKLMLEAMKTAKKNNAYILAHCEDESQLESGSLNKGSVSKKFNDPGINNASEYNHVIRDLKLAKKTKCNYHVCHVSTKESVEALRQAKLKNSNISAEVTCHHLFLNENDIDEDNGKWKMNPPLRSKEDQKALLDAILDGTIDMICTDNAPHSLEEKDCNIKESLMGIVSIEIAFSLVYTYLVKTKKLTLEQAVCLMSSNVANRFNVDGGNIKNNSLANFCIFDLDKKYIVDSTEFASLGKSCPFDGRELFGKCKMTVVDGEIVYAYDNFISSFIWDI